MNNMYKTIMCVCMALWATALSAQTHWTAPNPTDYQYDMTVIYSLQDKNGKALSHPEDYEVAAFAGDECRGVGEFVSDQGESWWEMRVRSKSVSGETVSFKYFDKVKQIEVIIAGVSESFASDAVIGTYANPLGLPTTIDEATYYTVSASVNNPDAGTISGTGDKQENSNATLVATPNTGYHFVRWTKGGNEMSTSATYVFAVTEDVSLTAVFAPNQHTLTFVKDNGEPNEVQEKAFGDAITKPADPTKEGHTFKGWSPEVPATVPDEDLTFTAQWDVNKYAVDFIVDDKVWANRSIPFGTGIEAPVPKKPFFAFTGWEPAIPATMPAQNLEFTAQFKKRGDVNGDDAIDAQDAKLILQIVAKKIKEGADGVDFEMADVNSDGKITAQDASLIMQRVAGKINW